MFDLFDSPSPFVDELFLPEATTHHQKAFRKKFDSEEDEKLKDLVKTFGENWSKVARNMPGRTTRQCRERYKNYLASHLRSDPWSKEEDDILLQKYEEFGPKWALISKFLNGRSDNCVKNRWYTHLKSPERVKTKHIAKSTDVQIVEAFDSDSISFDFLNESEDPFVL